MTQNALITGLLLLAIVLANAPFASPRFLLFGLSKTQRPVWQLFEIVLFYGAFIALARLGEGYFGQVQTQGWQFYVVSFCLFLSMAFPGFVWRYLLKKVGAS
jgi:hypothetical protein